MVFKNPGAQVIFSLHFTNPDTGEIIPGLQYTNPISISTFSALLKISWRSKIAGGIKNGVSRLT